MIGSIRSRWQYTWEDIWEPLATEEGVTEDLFIELYREAVPFVQPKLSLLNPKVLEILGSPEMAFFEFKKLSEKKFTDELSVISFLESVNDVLDEYMGEELTERYCQLVQEFVQRYNLRYVLISPFRLQVQIPWLYADLYEKLNLMNETNAHLKGLMSDFEQAFDLFVRTQSQRDLKTSISKASIYAEGVAGGIIGNSSKTLGAASKLIKDWPHATIRDALGNLYGFCSNYPGIRHAGNSEGKLRELKEKDTIIVSTLLMAYSSYMANENVEQILD